jgi:hypothetical protein
VFDEVAGVAGAAEVAGVAGAAEVAGVFIGAFFEFFDTFLEFDEEPSDDPEFPMFY